MDFSKIKLYYIFFNKEKKYLENIIAKYVIMWKKLYSILFNKI